MSRANQPIRVAVIGGGCASMAAALELSRPEHDGRYQVTVYQQGWRLGGKGASGRGPNGRIQEHGLHVWMGWYENAFRLLRECYTELGREWQDAFEPVPLIAVTDQAAPDEWVAWKRVFPPADGLPGDALDGAPPWTVGRYMARAAELVGALIARLDPAVEAGPLAGPDSTRDPATVLGGLARYGEIATLGGIAQAAATAAVVLESLGDGATGPVLAAVDSMSAAARRLLESRLDEDIEARRVWEVLDLTIATIRGNLRSGLLTDPRGFDVIDDYECREWLLLNGASPRSVDSAYLRGLYDLGFSYENADAEKPSISAGQALRGYMRSFFTYRGAFFWRMTAGMGDVVFAPMYEVLLRRGVRFEFFHRLSNVRLGGLGARADTPHVSALDLDVQARIRGGGTYRPLIDVKGLPCWPASPLFGQLEHGHQLLDEGWQFESHWDTRRAVTRTLEVGRDFDFVVLGVGLGAVPYVCRELVENDPRWRDMVDNLKTSATQALQLWLEPPTSDLGWPGPPITLSAFVKPFETWADMGHLISRESWPSNPGALAYFCGVLPDEPGLDRSDPRYPARMNERVRANAVRYLDRDIRHLWPNAVDDAGRFRWDLLVAADGTGASAGASGPARIDSQYWTANVNPSDRYTLALPGSSAYRISPLDATYDNLVVCGDWTDCGLNTGCVESAVVSGRLAAHALSMRPALEEIVGFDHP